MEHHIDIEKATRILGEAAQGADDADIYVERTRSESFVFDDGRLKSASYDTGQGFGMRVVAGEATGMAHASEVSEAAMTRAANTAAAAKRNYSGTASVSPKPINRRLYEAIDPTASHDFSVKSNLLQTIDAYCRAKDPRVVQVSATLGASSKEVDIIRPNGSHYHDHRPLVRVGISVTLEKDGRRESTSASAGGRAEYDQWIGEEAWQSLAHRAIEKASINLESIPAPAGEMPVVLGPGWPAVLIHEAVGHGLEGDFNRKGSSIYAGKIGEQVAAKGVTIVDDGAMEARRGSLTIDDEGTPTQRNVLIEDGILKGYMHDRQNARLMGVAPTGNGRRESYQAGIMPRMTNTIMLAGSHDPREMIASVERGLWAVDFGGGQVDITSGNFVFQCTEAYLIEGGRVGAPVKNATLIGHGPTVLQHVSMIGNDFAMDKGVGVCGKAGQTVPVGVGQPSLKIDKMTVGGSNS